MGAAAGSAGVDDAIAHRHKAGIGAEIMGAGKFGPPGWQDDDWRGWWGSEPPFRVTHLTFTRSWGREAQLRPRPVAGAADDDARSRAPPAAR